MEIKIYCIPLSIFTSTGRVREENGKFFTITSVDRPDLELKEEMNLYRECELKSIKTWEPAAIGTWLKRAVIPST